MAIKLQGQQLVNTETGEILSRDISPKFQNWTYDAYLNDFPNIRFIEVQTAKEADKDSIPENGYIAEQKLDGHRALCYMTEQGNRFFSRRISKKTNWFAENTDCVPHLRDFEHNLQGTVLDGEITMPTFSDVQSVLGALPETAIKNMIEKGMAAYNVFDILYYKGLRVENFPLHKRLQYLGKVFTDVKSDYIVKVPSYALKRTVVVEYPQLKLKQVESFKSLLYSMWDNGMEGLIVKDLNAPYEQKRTKHFLKLKPLLFRDVVIMGFQAPTREYDGKTLEEKGYWDFWEDYDDPSSPFEKRMTKEEMRKLNYRPVTKPYAKGWIGAIEYGVYKDGELIKVGEAKGISDTDLEYIRKNSDELIGTVIEVKANDFMDKSIGSLRHPRFSRFRTEDKGAEQCTWEDYINA